MGRHDGGLPPRRAEAAAGSLRPREPRGPRRARVGAPHDKTLARVRLSGSEAPGHFLLDGRPFDAIHRPERTPPRRVRSLRGLRLRDLLSYVFSDYDFLDYVGSRLLPAQPPIPH